MPPDARSLARRAKAKGRALLRGRVAAPADGAAQPPPLLTPADIATFPRPVLEAACRALASPVYLGGDTALCRILGRYKFHIDTRDTGFGANVLIDGYWETWLTQFMARTVRPGMTVADVGANYGYYSLLLADLVGPDGRVHAVEPNPAATRLLRRSVDLNGFAARTSIHEVALGAAEGGVAELFVPEGEPKNAALLADAAAAGGRRGQSHQVPLRSLSALIGTGRRLDFVKIDAEGAEEAILEGMTPLLDHHRPAMVLEFNAARYADPEAFLQRLLARYGALRFIDYDAEAVPVKPERVLNEHFGEDWLLFLGGT